MVKCVFQVVHSITIFIYSILYIYVLYIIYIIYCIFLYIIYWHGEDITIAVASEKGLNTRLKAVFE